MKDMITAASGFQYSVNIGYDISNNDKLKNFIPSKFALNLLESILLSVNPASTDRARVLIGAYGKGKSHIVLTILSILMKRELELFEKLMPKFQENPKLYQLVKNYYESKDKILPVIISGSSTNLAQSFILSLQRTLSDHKLLDAMPETNYKAAVRAIKLWRANFPETYEKFKTKIDGPVRVFVDRLENYDAAAYSIFERIYPSLTSGSIFNPFLGFEAAELYESVAKSLKSSGYTGIYVVYDEFSKFLEANIADASVSDTKMLQDFAEKCCRSGTLQLHLMLISHKEIANYIDKLPKEKTDGWRGVSERFKHVHISNSFSQTYEIISSVIQHKEPLWSKFCDSHTREFAALSARYQNHQMFKDSQGEIETVIYGCFPLHPVSTFILPRLSERVAQNERTLFTFLSAEGSTSLSAFLADYNNDFTLLTPDKIYDYFEPLLKKEIYSGEIHDIFVLTSNILNQLPEITLGRKIIKAISLIYILEQFERLSPTKEQIIGIYSNSYDISEIEHAISELIDKELVVYIKQSNGYLKLKQTSGVDIHKKIHDLLEAESAKITTEDILNSSNFDNYMYPSRYNDLHSMTRFFSFKFISGAEIKPGINWDIKSECVNADGVIYAVIPENEAQLEFLMKNIMLTSKGFVRYLFVLPKHFKDIKSAILEYYAVVKLRDEAAEDSVLFDDYEVVFEDLQEIIRNYISSYTRPESYSSIYIHDGEVLKINRKAELTAVISEICDKVYNLTPVVNNEAVNKNEITSSAQNSRNKIISALLRSELEPNLGLSGNGQEVSIMRSTLLRTGIWSEEEGIPKINLRPEDFAMRNLLETIENFILEARKNKPAKFADLYEFLTSPEHHIGLRYGLIPIYIAVVLHKYREQIVIHDRQGPVQICADLLVQINSRPDNYTLEFLDWDITKEEYISQLARAFADYVIDAERAVNSYDYVANAMRRWYIALPKYPKECTKYPLNGKLTQQQIKIMKLLQQNINSFDLLFKKLLEGFNDYSEVAKCIIEAKSAFDSMLDELKENLISRTKEAFLTGSNNKSRRKISLLDAVKEWCGQLDPKSFEQLFPDGTDRFLQHLKAHTDNEDLFITQLAKLASGLQLEDWDAKTETVYFETLARFMKTAKDFHSTITAKTINDTSSYQVIFSDEDGKSTTKRFDKVEISARGKLLFNQITASLEAMGHSISEQEKRQVLMEILRKIC